MVEKIGNGEGGDIEKYEADVKKRLGERFNIGDRVLLKRSSGEVEDDWYLIRINERGKVVLGKDSREGGVNRLKTKTVRAEDFLEWNPPGSSGEEPTPIETEEKGSENIQVQEEKSPLAEKWFSDENSKKELVEGNPLEVAWNLNLDDEENKSEIPQEEKSPISEKWFGEEDSKRELIKGIPLGEDEFSMIDRDIESALKEETNKEVLDFPKTRSKIETEKEEKILSPNIEDKAGKIETISEADKISREEEIWSLKNWKFGKDELDKLYYATLGMVGRNVNDGLESFAHTTSKLYRAVAFATKETFGKKAGEKIKEFKEEIERLEKEEGARGIATVFRGLARMGFTVQEGKGRFFSSFFSKLADEKKETFSKLPDEEKKKAEGDDINLKLLESYRDVYKKVEQKGMSDQKSLYEKGSKMKHAFGIGTFLGTGALAYRIAFGPGNPIRLVTAAALAMGRGGEAFKEAELRRESVINSGRVQDIDEAFNQAVVLYGRAGGKFDENKKTFTPRNSKEINRENLEKTYKEYLPQDLLLRLSSSEKISQKIAAAHINFSVGRIDDKLFKIEHSRLTDDEKKEEKEKIINKYSNFISEMDRMVANSGKIDMIAYYSRMAEKVGKGVAVAIAVETLAEGLWKGINALGDLFGRDSVEFKEAVEALPAAAKESPMEKGLEVEQTETASPEKLAGTESKDTSHLAKIFERAENPEIEKPEAFAKVAGTLFGEREVLRGDNLWRIVEKTLTEKGYLEGMNDSQRAYIADSVLDKLREMPSEKIQEMGISSGNPDLLYEGDHLDLDEIIKNGDVMSHTIERAKDLSLGEMESIRESAKAPEGMIEEENLPTSNKTFESIKDALHSATETPSSEADVLADSATSAESATSVPEDHSFESVAADKEIKMTPVTTIEEMEKLNQELDSLSNRAVIREINEIYTKKGFLGLFGNTSGILTNEWYAVKGRPASEFLDFYGNLFKKTEGGSISLIDADEKNFRLYTYIQGLLKDNKLKPENKETVESLIKRAIKADILRFRRAVAVEK